MDGGPSFMDGTVGTYSNHGIEITGDEEVRGRTRSSTWKSARSGCYCFQVQKINQDRGLITYPLADDHSMALLAVYDGHGANGRLSARRRAVDAAVVVLRRAVGGASVGARYLRHVDQWVAGLDPLASKLVAFSPAMKYAVTRLPAVAREAHKAFVHRMLPLVKPLVRIRARRAYVARGRV